MLVHPIAKIAKVNSQAKRQKKDTFVSKLTRKTQIQKNVFTLELVKLAIPAEIILEGRLNYGTK